MSSPEEIPAAPSVYRLGTITLYGIKLNKRGDRAVIPYDDKLLSIDVQAEGDRSSDVAIVVGYGYSYEGACYRFDKPKIFALGEYEEFEQASGCGFGDDYMMWTIAAKQTILELNTSVDFAETLILEANLPANRSPNTYGNHMQMAHRGGRLNRPSGGS
jgi:hypothetical protein